MSPHVNMDKSDVQHISSQKFSDITPTNNYKGGLIKPELVLIKVEYYWPSFAIRDAHVCSHLQSGERSFSSSSVKIGFAPIDFKLFVSTDPFDEETIPLLEPFGLLGY